MIAARWAMLLAAVLIALAAAGARAPDLQPSALRVMVAAVVGLLAPMFWPGIGAARGRTGLRMLAWTAGAACLAAMAMRLFGRPRQPVMPDLVVCGMLWLILVPTHAAAAALESALRRSALEADHARATAGVLVAGVLVLLGSLPLWLGPAAEVLSERHQGVVDTALAVSPLVHLAVAAANDLLRNGWFYQHSGLAALSFSYPGLAAAASTYAAASIVLTAVALTMRPTDPLARAAPQVEQTTENVP